MKSKVLIYLTLSGLGVLSSCTEDISSNVLSPDGTLFCSIETANDSIFINIEKDRKKLIERSPILINMDGSLINWSIDKKKSTIWVDSVNLDMGENIKSYVSANQDILELTGMCTKGDIFSAQLYLRVFDDNVAYRFILDLPEKSVIEEKTRLIQSDNSIKYYIPNGEFEPLGNVRMKDLDIEKQYPTPFVWEKDSFLLELHEASLHNYPSMRISIDKEKNTLCILPGEAILNNKVELPWRVFTIGKSWSKLHNNKCLYYNLSNPSSGDFEWVEPGLSVWDWRVRGCNFSGFTYDLNTASIKRFIDFASQNNIKYCLIDAHWYKQGKPLEPIPEVDIREIINYGNEKGVGLWLYYDLGYMKYSKKELDFNIVAETYSGWGAKGIKYGFLGTLGTKYTPQGKVQKTEELLKIAAKYKLMLDFHDNPIPFSGMERTYPNYLSREYCHAQMDRRTAFTPGQFVKMACLNLLAGAMDQSNGVYELNKIKERSKGPKNDFNSTLSSENARFFITHTGHFSVLIDAPEAYMNKSEMFDFIKHLPDCWDETIYLDMDFNSHVSVARRKNDTWFVGTVYNEVGGEHILNLDFLDDNSKYEITVYKDRNDTHYIKNKESFEISKSIVTKESSLSLYVAPGGGYTAIIRKI